MSNSLLSADVLLSLIEDAKAAADGASFLEVSLERLRQLYDWDQAGWVRPWQGQWQWQVSVGESGPPPNDLVGDATDAGAPMYRAGWLAVPDQRRDLLGCLVFRGGRDAWAESDYEAVTAGLSSLWGLCEHLPPVRLWQSMRDWLAAGAALPIRPSLIAAGEFLEETRRTLQQALAADRVTLHSQPVSSAHPVGWSVPICNERGKCCGHVVIDRDRPWSESLQQTVTEIIRVHEAVLSHCLQRVAEVTGRSLTAASQVQLVGECPAIAELRRRVDRVADTDLAVLVLGENGTGKEVVSQSIHWQSARRSAPLLAVNCAALAESLLESELFGHEKGAFTDAHESRAGKFELASGGSLFLDEIGELSLRAQAKLLRVLEEKSVIRLGGYDPIPIDTRLIAATNRDLAAMLRDQTFREDLYFRLHVVVLEIPPLRDRGDDILTLAEMFLQSLSEQAHRISPRLTTSARQELLRYPWPGNVRELRNLIERLVFLYEGEDIDAERLELRSRETSAPFDIDPHLTLADATRQFQADYIEYQIRANQGNMTATSQRLGLHRTNLYRKMKQLGNSPGDEDK